MKLTRCQILTIAFVSIINTSAWGESVRMVSGQITQAGIYEAESVEQSKAPGTTTGYTSTAKGLKLVKSTDIIPAKLGNAFGFEYVLIGLEPNKSFELKKIIAHPKITKPDGSTSEGYEMKMTRQADAFGTIKDISGYIFNNDYETQPGVWKFTLMYGKEKLIEKIFTVVDEQP